MSQVDAVAVRVTTVAAGRDYRVRVTASDGRVIGRYRIMAGDGGMVSVFTPDSCLGLYRMERFGGHLSPVTVRAFVCGT